MKLKAFSYPSVKRKLTHGQILPFEYGSKFLEISSVLDPCQISHSLINPTHIWSLSNPTTISAPKVCRDFGWNPQIIRGHFSSSNYLIFQ